MLLRFFKTNHQFLIVFVLLAGLAMWMPVFINPSPIIEPAPSEWLYAILYGLITRINPLIVSLFAFALLFVQSIVFNNLIINHSLLEKNTFIPALVYIVIMSLFPQYCTLHQAHFLNLMFLVYLNVIFRFFPEGEPQEEVFLSMAALGVLSMFFNASFPILIIFWAGFIVFLVPGWRIWVVSLIGFAVPYIFLTFYFFWTDKLTELNMMRIIFQNQKIIPDFNVPDTYIKAALTLLFVYAAFRYTIYTRDRIIMLRKFASLLFIALLVFILTFFFIKGHGFINLIPAVIPVSLYISHLFMRIRRQWIAELLFIMLIGILIFYRIS